VSKTQRVADKILMASELATVGSAIGPVGTIGGALTGLLIGDQQTVFPMDMVAIPAFQTYLLTDTPSFMIYIKEGEVLNQVIPTDAEVAEEVVNMEPGPQVRTRRKQKMTPYQRKYKAAFNRIKGRYKKKDGQWKKGGFKAAVKAAHKIAGGKK